MWMGRDPPASMEMPRLERIRAGRSPGWPEIQLDFDSLVDILIYFHFMDYFGIWRK
jgi:hypothetical protein